MATSTPPDNNGKEYKKRKEDPRTTVFKMFFLDPRSATFWNVRGSAIRAGYKEDYASNITNRKPKWWVELLESAEFNRAEMLWQAEKNLRKTLSQEPQNDTQEKIRHDATKFVAERVGKDFYSTRQEVTGADGRRLFDNTAREAASVPIAQLFKGVAKE
jgi:hypothetical protein